MTVKRGAGETIWFSLVWREDNEGNRDEDCVKKVEDIVKRVGLMGDPRIERAHRIGRKRINNPAPRPLIVKFLSFVTKTEILAKRRMLPDYLGMVEDHPIEIREARKSPLPKMKAAKKDGKTAFIAYPARLIIDGHVHEVVDPVTMKRT